MKTSESWRAPLGIFRAKSIFLEVPYFQPIYSVQLLCALSGIFSSDLFLPPTVSSLWIFFKFSTRSLLGSDFCGLSGGGCKAVEDFLGLCWAKALNIWRNFDVLRKVSSLDALCQISWCCRRFEWNSSEWKGNFLTILVKLLTIRLRVFGTGAKNLDV